MKFTFFFFFFGKREPKKRKFMYSVVRGWDFFRPHGEKERRHRTERDTFLTMIGGEMGIMLLLRLWSPGHI